MKNLHMNSDKKDLDKDFLKYSGKNDDPLAEVNLQNNANSATSAAEARISPESIEGGVSLANENTPVINTTPKIKLYEENNVNQQIDIDIESNNLNS